MTAGKQVGLTKSQGWEMGVSRTLPISRDELWNILSKQPGLGIWSGLDTEIKLEKGKCLETRNGTKIEIRSYHEGKRIRMRWQPIDWDFVSIFQVTVTPIKEKALLRFHQEKLDSFEQREYMIQYWSKVLSKLEDFLSKETHQK